MSTQMDVVSQGSGGAAPAPSASVAMADPRTREQIKELVAEALSERLRQLERQGLV